MQVLLAAGALALVVLPASADTWFVDDDGGAGVHFTDIQPAVDAASTGDVIRVFPGTYGGFTLDRALAVIGEPGAIVNWGPATWVNAINDGQVAVVSGLQFLNWGHDVKVQACSVPIVLDDLWVSGGIEARLGANDVRARGCFARGFKALDGARLEVSESQADGIDGTVLQPHGAAAVYCEVGSVLHIYRSILQGGDGDDAYLPTGAGGDGGPGALASGELLLAGDAIHTVQGGIGGDGNQKGKDGAGLSLLTPGVARVSGVTVAGTSQEPGTVIEPVVPDDPALRILAQAGPGGTVTFRLHAEPGSSAVLDMGRIAIVLAQPGTAEDGLVKVLRTFDMGTVGPDGVVGFNFKLPASATMGFTFFAQARVTLPGGETRYSNSVPLVVH